MSAINNFEKRELQNEGNYEGITHLQGVVIS